MWWGDWKPPLNANSIYQIISWIFFAISRNPCTKTLYSIFFWSLHLHPFETNSSLFFQQKPSKHFLTLLWAPPSRELTYPTKREKEHHLQNWLFRGYVGKIYTTYIPHIYVYINIIYCQLGHYIYNTYVYIYISPTTFLGEPETTTLDPFVQIPGRWLSIFLGLSRRHLGERFRSISSSGRRLTEGARQLQRDIAPESRYRSNPIGKDASSSTSSSPTIFAGENSLLNFGKGYPKFEGRINEESVFFHEFLFGPWCFQISPPPPNKLIISKILKYFVLDIFGRRSNLWPISGLKLCGIGVDQRLKLVVKPAVVFKSARWSWRRVRKMRQGPLEKPNVRKSTSRKLRVFHFADIAKTELVIFRFRMGWFVLFGGSMTPISCHWFES